LFVTGKSLPVSCSRARRRPSSSSKKRRCSSSGQERSSFFIEFGDDAVTKRSGRATEGSTLQRPPPLIRIFRPPSSVRSSSVTFAPPRAAWIAAIRPAAPAPTTTTRSSAKRRS
jgi:hypothetical protein